MRYVGVILGLVAVTLGVVSWVGGMHRVPPSLTLFCAGWLVYFSVDLFEHPAGRGRLVIGMCWGAALAAYFAGWR